MTFEVKVQIYKEKINWYEKLTNNARLRSFFCHLENYSYLCTLKIITLKLKKE